MEPWDAMAVSVVGLPAAIGVAHEGGGVVNTLKEKVSGSTDWWTPLPVVRALGSFDLDPCGNLSHPTAAKIIQLPEDGLTAGWAGRVWLNPPYGPGMGAWLDRLALYGNGTALIFARTQTKAFQRAAANARCVLFLEGKIKFLRGGVPVGNPTTGSALLAYSQVDEENMRMALFSGLLRGRIFSAR